jgi:hypothetical protein
MNHYIFLTNEGYTFQPESESDMPDIENLQVVGFSSGKNQDEAFANLMHDNAYLKQTSFREIFCYKLDSEYLKTRKEFTL